MNWKVSVLNFSSWSAISPTVAAASVTQEMLGSFDDNRNSTPVRLAPVLLITLTIIVASSPVSAKPSLSPLSEVIWTTLTIMLPVSTNNSVAVCTSPWALGSTSLVQTLPVPSLRSR